MLKYNKWSSLRHIQPCVYFPNQLYCPIRLLRCLHLLVGEVLLPSSLHEWKIPKQIIQEELGKEKIWSRDFEKKEDRHRPNGLKENRLEIVIGVICTLFTLFFVCTNFCVLHKNPKKLFGILSYLLPKTISGITYRVRYIVYNNSSLRSSVIHRC